MHELSTASNSFVFIISIQPGQLVMVYSFCFEAIHHMGKSEQLLVDLLTQVWLAVVLQLGMTHVLTSREEYQ